MTVVHNLDTSHLRSRRLDLVQGTLFTGGQDDMVQKRISRILEEPSVTKSVKHDYLTCVSVCVCREREKEREKAHSSKSQYLWVMCLYVHVYVCVPLFKHGLGFKV